MAEGIVFLDVDDEITSAASRIRSAPGTKVALVVPNGSRIATSRINFRLLSREALVSNRRLSVIAGDAASRALAASAGLPVFATVAEYEAALAGPRPEVDDDLTALVAPPPVSEPAAERPAEPDEALAPERAPRRAKKAAPPAATEPEAAVVASPVVARATVPDATRRMAAPTRPTRPIDTAETVEAGIRPPVIPSLGRIRAPVVAAVAAIAFAVVLAGAAAYLLLPSATIALTPRHDSVEVPLTIAADVTATEVDAANSRIPALKLEIPVQTSQTFTTAGRHVELATASGSVTFENYNTGSNNRIAAGSIVSTEGGIRFRTLATVNLPPANLVPTTPVTVEPSRRSVAVQAVRAGPAGNVPANAIRVVPQGEDPILLKVNNPDATSGGARNETPEVTKAEVDKAVAAVTKELRTSFNEAIAGGAGAPAGAELFPTTANLGVATFTVDPASLVGKAVESFDLEAGATGTVIAVDPSPIRAIAEARLREQIGADHRLVDGSLNVDVSKGSVGEDGQVTYQATATASRVLIVDASQLRALVKGRTAADAAAALAPYGVATVTLWPSWVTTVTGVDARLSIDVDEGTNFGGAGTSASPTVRRSPAPKPSAGSSAP